MTTATTTPQCIYLPATSLDPHCIAISVARMVSRFWMMSGGPSTSPPPSSLAPTSCHSTPLASWLRTSHGKKHFTNVFSRTNGFRLSLSLSAWPLFSPSVLVRVRLTWFSDPFFQMVPPQSFLPLLRLLTLPPPLVQRPLLALRLVPVPLHLVPILPLLHGLPVPLSLTLMS